MYILVRPTFSIARRMAFLKNLFFILSLKWLLFHTSDKEIWDFKPIHTYFADFLKSVDNFDESYNQILWKARPENLSPP